MSSTSSQGSADLASGSNEPECEPSRSAKSTHSAEVSSPSTGPTSPATTTCEVLPLTGSQQMELLPMSSVAVSPARTSASQEKARELKAAAAAYGQSTPELLANYDPASSSWRTSQLCLDGALTEFSETWPRSGLMQNGTAYLLPPLVPLTAETDFGSWLTPQAQDAKHSGLAASDQSRDLLAVQVQMWPTPRAEYDSGRHKGKADTLHSAVKMWPTPHGFSQDGKSNGPSGNELGRAVNQSLLPTPTANRRNGLQSHGVNVVSGSLNPTWVEWLMGFPLGWTVLEALATPSSRKSRKSSGGQS
jgi:hypothetical protein